jgi:hypothetical protein
MVVAMLACREHSDIIHFRGSYTAPCIRTSQGECCVIREYDTATSAYEGRFNADPPLSVLMTSSALMKLRSKTSILFLAPFSRCS